ncbi:MAG: valine--tRNA ligase [Candidatus Pacebacteria bacterium RIFOXYB1_FULL_39_46]|nr:MAG: valine--tRNA ligase [Candidatus Pacebacteria bacterium RIFOXYA1_FULL_38_18]OGJ38059.1 MAG: valine--tRNA ligase [Candidatus Pacebacteria bacterium RIFOXYB1_FULL_39_46]OGJ39718.1 MAG: valine--tRNA ligase [Candidatus Pacebacteria bacterium RIFOXYC1_FULL_39_21]OGJ39811.1 MAG: valine--tRNA ligase [Candidatus Pacebacteria bacterium RIFOXYD1_FULL_39_27]
MDKRYDHQEYEQKIYGLWEENQVFSPAKQLAKNQKPFTIIMPPPNANDPLHVGHAMFVAIEDVLTRFHRMLGDDTLWLPGADHAGIETQFVFEKKLKKENKTRFDFDRETLYQMIWDYVQENSGVAIKQMKRLGASADWSRFVFTLDQKAVDEALKTLLKLDQDDLLYRDEQLVNYCTHCGTSFSELEVIHQEQTTPLYYVKYPLVDRVGEFVTVATVRPEPIFADTHLAVNPKDKKRRALIGKKVLNPLTQVEMEIIGDDFVDPDFGTGVVKLTPAHDREDFAVAKKLGLPINPAIDLMGRIVATGGKYAGLKVKVAREQVVADLQKNGLIEKIDESYKNRIATCYRCKHVIEPLLLPQFFIKVKPLVKPVLEALKEKKIRIHGTGYDKILKHWLENLYDWNISRQIVWGIRMPVWYDLEKNLDLSITFLTKTGEKITGTSSELLAKNYAIKEIGQGLQELRAPLTAEYMIALKSPGENYLQETDTLDTWFSSAQWPFTTLKSLSEKDFERFYPTQVLETAYDILMFWVMRMLFMGKYVTGKLPFTDIYLHGLIRDAKGQKMSKSKGNVVNPMELTEKYGADALRMALIIRSTPGLDKAVGEQDFRAMRNLTNKLWNASRFVLEHLDTTQAGEEKINDQFNKKIEEVSQVITKNLTNFQLGLAAETAYNEFWHWYCDECIETAKAGKLGGQQLIAGLQTFLKLLHPFTPFVTEAVWQTLVEKKITNEPLLITALWPTKSKE